MDVKDLASNVLAQLAIGIDCFKGTWIDVVKNVPRAIKAVETVGKQFSLSGTDKKALAIMVLDAIVTVKWMPGFVKRAILDIAIEGIVAAFNMFGKDWLEKL